VLCGGKTVAIDERCGSVFLPFLNLKDAAVKVKKIARNILDCNLYLYF
jgi:hypothetical protein